MSKLLIQFNVSLIIFLEEIETFSKVKDIYLILKLQSIPKSPRKIFTFSFGM